jgi:hypothetical protein
MTSVINYLPEIKELPDKPSSLQAQHIPVELMTTAVKF